jgi:hypothetical protein
MYSISKKTYKAIYISTLPFYVKVSKLHPIFSKFLKTVTMISAEASTANKAHVLHSITWEVKFQMLLEFQARNNHVKVTQGNSTQLIYSRVRKSSLKRPGN